MSTEQVSQVIQTMPSVDFCSVYGVELEGHEGKAGMAAIQLKDGATFDAELASKIVNENLFPAARPLFIRIVEHLPVTNTLKLTKVQLEKEGANPRNISDALYFYNQDAEQYEPLGPDEYDSLLE